MVHKLSLKFDKYGGPLGRDYGPAVLNFDKVMPASVTYARTGNSARITRAGIISFVGADVAPVTDRGLLIEPARTNSMPNSNAFSGGSPVTTGHASPDGANGASLLTEGATVSNHGVDKLVSGTPASTAYALSLFAKRKDFDWCSVVLNDGLGQRRANFDLANGVVGAIDANLTASILAIGAGWYRCSIMGVTTAGSSQVLSRYRLQRIPGNSATVSTTYQGDNASGMYTWECQTEQGAFPTSPIKTTTAASRGAPTVTAKVPSGFAKALLTYADGTTTLATGLTPGGTFDIAAAVLGANKGRWGVSELARLQWQK